MTRFAPSAGHSPTGCLGRDPPENLGHPDPDWSVRIMKRPDLGRGSSRMIRANTGPLQSGFVTYVY